MPTTKHHVPKWQLVLIAAIIAIAIVIQLWPDEAQTEKFYLDGNPIIVEVADTLEAKFKGLGGRTELGYADAMLFPFSYKAKHGFVMRDMSFPIDIIWLNDGVVVDIAPNVQTEPDVTDERGFTVYTPRDVANAVLEFEAGWVDTHELKIGDQLELK